MGRDHRSQIGDAAGYKLPRTFIISARRMIDRQALIKIGRREKDIVRYRRARVDSRE